MVLHTHVRKFPNFLILQRLLLPGWELSKAWNVNSCCIQNGIRYLGIVGWEHDWHKQNTRLFQNIWAITLEVTNDTMMLFLLSFCFAFMKYNFGGGGIWTQPFEQENACTNDWVEFSAAPWCYFKKHSQKEILLVAKLNNFYILTLDCPIVSGIYTCSFFECHYELFSPSYSVHIPQADIMLLFFSKQPWIGLYVQFEQLHNLISASLFS